MIGMKRYLLVWLLVILAGRASAQINFLFQAEVYGRSVDGLGNFQIQNLTGGAKKAQVVITVRENISKTQVLTITSPVFAINPGTTVFPMSIYGASTFNFTNTPIAAIASQTRNFPPGEYTYCFSLMDGHVTDDENCFDATIEPLVPIDLIYPADEDKICQKRPPLSWKPPVPFPATMRFRLQLAEKKQGTSVESLLMNAPLILLDNIPSTTVNYPSYAPDLEEGKTYCWQVIAYQNNVILSKSEIWEFTVQCGDSVVPGMNDSYRELKLLMNGNFYIATRTIKFSMTNNYNVKKLDYEIYSTDNGFKKIKNTPVISLARGFNKIDIDLTDLDLQDGKHYILRVYPFNEQEVSIRFIYQENGPSN